jgi:quercetin dioxygenase-like cupin family protein
MKMNRRNALALGATSLAAPLLVAKPTPVAAKAYGPTDGKEIFPGVRLVELGTRDSHIKGYKKIAMEDVVYQPKGSSPLGDVMADDMVCTVTEGELQVTAGDMEFTAKEGDVWSCGKGSTKEAATNNGTVVAVMRVINLKAA